MLKANIIVKKENGKIIFKKESLYSPKTKEFKLINKLSQNLESGKYYVIIKIMDLFSRISSFDFFKFKISNNLYKNTKFSNKNIKNNFSSIMNGSAEKGILQEKLNNITKYSEKINGSAIRFFCKEQITISTLKIDPRLKAYLRSNQKLWNSDLLRINRNYIFDYQLIYQDGKIFERRKSLNGNKKLIKDPQKLIKSIFSKRPVFGPNVLFLHENRDKYIFKINEGYSTKWTDQITMKFKSKLKRDIFHSGEVIIDNGSSAVRKMIFNLKPDSRFRSQLGFAQSLSAKLYLKCILYFGAKHGDMYFPSKVEIIETYKGGDFIRNNFGIKGWERTRIIYRYFDYRFFSVDMNIKLKNGNNL